MNRFVGTVSFVLLLGLYAEVAVSQSSDWRLELIVAMTEKRIPSGMSRVNVACVDNDPFISVVADNIIPVGGDPVLVTERGRERLARTLSVRWAADDGDLGDREIWEVTVREGLGRGFTAVFSAARSPRAGSLISELKRGRTIRFEVADPGASNLVILDEEFSLRGSSAAIAQLRCM